MSEQMKFVVKIEATGEVRDKDGNLISSTPVESTQIVTAEELKALGIEPPTQ